MEYEFIHDTTTGQAKAKFSLDHQIMGPWLELEIGHDIRKLTQVLTALDNIERKNEKELTITGSEYSLVVNKEDATIQSNIMLNGELVMPDELSSDDLQFDHQEGASCGIEDFRHLLLSWANFTKIEVA